MRGESSVRSRLMIWVRQKIAEDQYRSQIVKASQQRQQQQHSKQDSLAAWTRIHRTMTGPLLKRLVSPDLSRVHFLGQVIWQVVEIINPLRLSLSLLKDL
jgi:hypothetical protein